MIETPGAGAPQSPWWYRNRSSVFGTLYAAAFWIPSNGTLKPSLAQGLLTETFTLSLFLGMCCFFAPMPYGLFGFIAFFVLGIVSQRFFARYGSAS